MQRSHASRDDRNYERGFRAWLTEAPLFLCGPTPPAGTATAYGHRGWPYNFVVTSAWSDPTESENNIAWTRELFAAMGPFRAPAAYVNYLGGDEGVEGLHAAYGVKLARLAALKARFDPGNMFRLNQNIAPASTDAV